jgi:citrate lyase alpha subunit
MRPARWRLCSLPGALGAPCRRSIVQPTASLRMNVNEINAYLQRAREIIGDRTPSEIAYHDSIVAHLSRDWTSNERFEPRIRGTR